MPTTSPALQRITCNVGAKVLQAASGSDSSSFPAVFVVAGKTLNGEYIPANVLADAAALFVGAKMFINHPRRPEDQMTRDLRDLAGRVESCEFSGDELRGTIKMSDTVSWLRTLISEGIGGDLSINVMGTIEWKDDMPWITSITEVVSIDFVTVGAAQGRVLEAFNASQPSSNPPTPTPRMDISTLTLAELRASRSDLITAIVEESKTTADAKALTEEYNALKTQVATFEAKEKVAAHETMIVEALTASGIDAKLHDGLRPALVALEQRDEMDKVLASVKQSLAATKPASKGNPAVEDQKAATGDKKIEEAMTATFGI